MITKAVQARLDREAVAEISRGELESLLKAARTLRSEDTHMSGWIRILLLGEAVPLQEQTPAGEVLLTKMPSREEAERVVDGRLATYERMWDGCGCRVDYRR